MIDQSQLSEAERIELKKIALTKKKESLEKELEDMKYKSLGLKDGKTVEHLKQYFQDWLIMQKDKEFLKSVRKRNIHKRNRIKLNNNVYIPNVSQLRDYFK